MLIKVMSFNFKGQDDQKYINLEFLLLVIANSYYFNETPKKHRNLYEDFVILDDIHLSPDISKEMNVGKNILSKSVIHQSYKKYLCTVVEFIWKGLKNFYDIIGSANSKNPKVIAVAQKLWI